MEDTRANIKFVQLDR